MPTLIKNKRNRGFSLLELLIVIAIFTIITTIALFDQGKLNSDVLLTNLAYDVALTAREAQSYGVGVRYSEGNTGGGYGVHLNTINSDTIVVFQDIVSDGIYDPDIEEVRTYQFLNQRGNKIAGLCGNSGGTLACDIASMNITFVRPDPEANFNVDGSSDFSGPAYIVLKSNDGTNCRAVVVENSGQIRVEGSGSEACDVVTP